MKALLRESILLIGDGIEVVALWTQRFGNWLEELGNRVARVAYRIGSN